MPAQKKKTRAEKVAEYQRYFFVKLLITKKIFFVFEKKIDYDLCFYTKEGKYFNKVMLQQNVLGRLKLKSAKIGIQSIIEMKKSDYDEFILSVDREGRPTNNNKNNQGNENGKTKNDK